MMLPSRYRDDNYHGCLACKQKLLPLLQSYPQCSGALFNSITPLDKALPPLCNGGAVVGCTVVGRERRKQTKSK